MPLLSSTTWSRIEGISMGKASRRKKRTQSSPVPAPSPERYASRAYTFTPLKLFVGCLLLLGVGFTAGVFVQAGMKPMQSASSSSAGGSSVASSAPLKMPSLEELQRIEQLKAHLEHSPEEVESRIQLGHALFDAGNYNQAIEQYQVALEKQPLNADVRTDMGIAFRRTGRPEQAVHAFRHAIQDDPQHVNAHYNLGVILTSELDDPAGAVAAWERVLELAPNSPRQAELRKAVQQLRGRLAP